MLGGKEYDEISINIDWSSEANRDISAIKTLFSVDVQLYARCTEDNILSYWQVISSSRVFWEDFSLSRNVPDVITYYRCTPVSSHASKINIWFLFDSFPMLDPKRVVFPLTHLCYDVPTIGIFWTIAIKSPLETLQFQKASIWPCQRVNHLPRGGPCPVSSWSDCREPQIAQLISSISETGSSLNAHSRRTLWLGTAQKTDGWICVIALGKRSDVLMKAVGG